MEKISRDIRKKLLEISSIGKDGNLQSCFSSVEILWTLYDKILNFNKDNIGFSHDRFVLSKGQSNLALMTVLAFKGFIWLDELTSFNQIDSRIAMQADRTKFGGLIENSAGSLGHGFPMAVGMAWASKIKKDDERVFVLAGDGEMNEGTMWEAMLFASSEKLNNLTLIVDDNESIRRMIDFGDFIQKFKSFGFDVEVVDGHSISELETALSIIIDRPRVIIAKTHRGFGSNTLMNDRSWFHRYPKDDELEVLLKEVDDFEKDDATVR